MINFQINSGQTIAVASRQVIENKDIDKDFILISARDKDFLCPTVTSLYLKDALYLCFDDIDGPYKNYVHMTDDHAKEIVDFVLKNKTHSTIVCQCEAGVSRSAAMAASIVWYFTGDDSVVFTNKFLYPNRYVYRKLVEEFIRQGCEFEPKFDQQIPYTEGEIY